MTMKNDHRIEKLNENEAKKNAYTLKSLMRKKDDRRRGGGDGGGRVRSTNIANGMSKRKCTM